MNASQGQTDVIIAGKERFGGMLNGDRKQMKAGRQGMFIFKVYVIHKGCKSDLYTALKKHKADET